MKERVQGPSLGIDKRVQGFLTDEAQLRAEAEAEIMQFLVEDFQIAVHETAGTV